MSPDLRERIVRSVATLGYTPRRSPRPKTPQSPDVSSGEDTIAVLAGDLLNPYFPQVLRGIQDEADNYGSILTLYSMTDHPQRQQQLLQRLSRQKTHGLIVMGGVAFPDLLAWRERYDVPMVVLNRSVNRAGVHCIVIDFENAIFRAVQHLLSLGHTRIGYIGGARVQEISQARQRGLEKALAEAGLPLRPEWCPQIQPGVEIDGGFQAMGLLLDMPADMRPTGLIAFNDVVALGALHAIQARGLRVHQDFSIIGVDDIFAAAHSSPPLTTVSQPKYRMGVLAVQALARMRQEGRSEAGSWTVLESPLIVRESTGPAPQPASSAVGTH